VSEPTEPELTRLLAAVLSESGPTAKELAAYAEDPQGVEEALRAKVERHCATTRGVADQITVLRSFVVPSADEDPAHAERADGDSSDPESSVAAVAESSEIAGGFQRWWFVPVGLAASLVGILLLSPPEFGQRRGPPRDLAPAPSTASSGVPEAPGAARAEATPELDPSSQAGDEPALLAGGESVAAEIPKADTSPVEQSRAPSPRVPTPSPRQAPVLSADSEASDTPSLERTPPQASSEPLAPVTPAPPTLVAMAEPEYRTPFDVVPRQLRREPLRSRDVGFSLTAMVPPHIARTLVPSPTLVWRFEGNSKSNAGPIRLELSGGAELVTRELPWPEDSGLQQTALSRLGVTLLPDREYVWTIEVALDEDEPSGNPRAVGWIEWVPGSLDEERELSALSPAERPAYLAKQGYWYDALAAILDLDLQTAGAPSVRAGLDSLLAQADLVQSSNSSSD